MRRDYLHDSWSIAFAGALKACRASGITQERQRYGKGKKIKVDAVLLVFRRVSPGRKRSYILRCEVRGNAKLTEYQGFPKSPCKREEEVHQQSKSYENVNPASWLISYGYDPSYYESINIACAKFYAQLNCALADATIASRDCKDFCNSWRPTTAIRYPDNYLHFSRSVYDSAPHAYA